MNHVIFNKTASLDRYQQLYKAGRPWTQYELFTWYSTTICDDN